MSMFIDYYSILGIDPTADSKQIKKAYRKLAKNLHPDAYPDTKLSEEQLEQMRIDFTRVNEAYEVLGNEEQRKIYDVKYRVYNQHIKRQEELRKQEEQERQRREAWERQREQDMAFEDIERIFRKAQEKREQEEKRRQEEQEKQPKKASNKPYETDSFWKQFKRDYRSVVRQEKKESFHKRHEDVEGCFEDVYKSKVDSVPKEIIYQTAKGTVHVFVEAFYHLRNLRFTSKDSIQRYILRNRRVFAGALAAGIICTSGLWNPKPEPEPLQGSSISITDIDEYVEEPITMTRKYQIKYGDNLSTLAENSYSSVDELKRLNNLSNSLIIADHYLTIPYHIKRENLGYYTQSVLVQNRSLQELATTFQTDVNTIYNLNKEAIQRIDGNYIIMSNEVLVPNFITREELKSIKGTSYQ